VRAARGRAGAGASGDALGLGKGVGGYWGWGMVRGVVARERENLRAGVFNRCAKNWWRVEISPDLCIR
jgi:hypothetical protein